MQCLKYIDIKCTAFFFYGCL